MLLSGRLALDGGAFLCRDKEKRAIAQYCCRSVGYLIDTAETRVVCEGIREAVCWYVGMFSGCLRGGGG